MGLLDFGAKVITTYKADVSDMKRGLRELTAEEKKLQAQLIKSEEERNRQLDGWVTKLGHVGLAIGAVQKVTDIGIAAFDEYEDVARLRQGAAGISIDRLRDATKGLVKEVDLLTFAQRTNNGAFKLSEQEMVVAAKAARALGSQGHDTAAALAKITDALVKGNGAALDDFGIHVRDATTEGGKFKNLMEELAVVAKNGGDAQLSAGEKIRATGVDMADSFSRLKQSMGELVLAFSPLLDALSFAIGGFASLAAEVVGFFSNQQLSQREQKIRDRQAQYLGRDDLLQQNMQGSTWEAIAARVESEKLASAEDMPQWLVAWHSEEDQRTIKIAASAREMAEASVGVDETIASLNETLTGIIARTKRDNLDLSGGKRRGGARRENTLDFNASFVDGRFAQSMFGDDPILDMSGMGGSFGAYTDGLAYLERMEQKSREVLVERLTSYLTQARADAERVKAEAQAAKRESLLSAMFGSPGEFTTYIDLFGALTDSVSSAFGAWIDGTASVGDAFKKSVAGFLKGEAMRMLVLSLRSVGEAILDRDPSKLAAAAKFGTGAALAGAFARELGGDAPGGSGGGSLASGSQFVPAGQSSDGGIRSTIVIGDQFGYDSPYMRSLQAQRMVALALGETGVMQR